jgi:hypothetical protein
LKNKTVIYIAAGIIFMIITVFFLYVSTFAEPKIIFNTQINNISDDEYKGILKGGQVISSDKRVEKFKHINLNIKIKTPFPILTHAIIEKDNSQQFFIQSILKDNTKLQILNGGGFALSNGKEYSETIEIYMRNTSEDELKAILGDLKIKVSWQNIWNSKENKVFYLKDYLK